LNRRHAALIAAKVLVSGLLLAVVLAGVDLAQLAHTLREADVPLVVAWLACIVVANALAARRWTLLSRRLDFGTALKYTWIGAFYGQVLPGSLTGELAKGVALGLKDPSARPGLASSIVSDKVIGLAALVVVFDVACLALLSATSMIHPAARRLALIALVLTTVGAGVAAWLLRLGLRPAASRTIDGGRVARAVSGVAASLRYYAERPGRVVAAFLLSFAVHGALIVGTYLGFRALGIAAGVSFAGIVYAIVQIVLMVPISISGIGLRDATIALLFVTYGLSAEAGIALSWLTLLASVPNLLIGGSIQIAEVYRTR
jgi:uncharacterized protein (TIRG00374 family)